jgi:mannose-1-phosphate guanylyltransferase/mannose-6-phosphate isomerase
MGEESLFQSSALRLSGPGFWRAVSCDRLWLPLHGVEQLAAVDIAPRDILIEPSARNTAAAICAAAIALKLKEARA